MAMYCNIPLTVYEVSASSEALELLKTSSLFTKIKDQSLSLEIIHTYGAIQDEMTTIKFIFDRKGKYMEDALQGKAKEVLAGNDITAASLWEAITSSNEGRQFLRELYRLQIFYSSDKTLATITETIAKIKAYIGE